jgi:hypothetical protein
MPGSMKTVPRRRATPGGGCSGAALFAAMLGAGPSCVTPRTEIVVRLETDMPQGPNATLASIRVTVTSEGEPSPRFDQTYPLAVGDPPIALPADLGIVPRDRSSRAVTIEVQAFGSRGLLFTRRSSAAFVPDHTLAMPVFLADRCRDPGHQVCADGTTCGRSDCEPIQQAGLADVVPGDAGP